MNIEKVCFRNERNDDLTGYYFSPDQYENKSPILFAPSIGIKQSYYRNFCQWLCQQGHPVLSFDFNGIGESLKESPAKSTAAIRYWGEYLSAICKGYLNGRLGFFSIFIFHCVIFFLVIPRPKSSAWEKICHQK